MEGDCLHGAFGDTSLAAGNSCWPDVLVASTLRFRVTISRLWIHSSTLERAAILSSKWGRGISLTCSRSPSHYCVT